MSLPFTDDGDLGSDEMSGQNKGRSQDTKGIFIPKVLGFDSLMLNIFAR